MRSRPMTISLVPSSCKVATALRQRGFDARYIRGGLAAWHGAEGPRAVRAAG